MLQMGFRAEVVNFQPYYTFLATPKNWDNLRIGAAVLKETLDRIREKEEQARLNRVDPKAVQREIAQKVKMAYEDDRLVLAGGLVSHSNSLTWIIGRKRSVEMNWRGKPGRQGQLFQRHRETLDPLLRHDTSTLPDHQTTKITMRLSCRRYHTHECRGLGDTHSGKIPLLIISRNNQRPRRTSRMQTESFLHSLSSVVALQLSVTKQTLSQTAECVRGK